MQKWGEMFGERRCRSDENLTGIEPGVDRNRASSLGLGQRNGVQAGVEAGQGLGQRIALLDGEPLVVGSFERTPLELAVLREQSRLLVQLHLRNGQIGPAPRERQHLAFAAQPRRGRRVAWKLEDPAVRLDRDAVPAIVEDAECAVREAWNGGRDCIAQIVDRRCGLAVQSGPCPLWRIRRLAPRDGPHHAFQTCSAM
jgi:hypothetical protein